MISYDKEIEWLIKLKRVMKKLSIEEKAKRYDEALEKARDVYTYYCEDSQQVRKIESIFPELKESEDEKIRKALISILKSDFEKDTTIYDISVCDIIAWLENQETSYTKKDVDDAYLKGISDAKNEIERQYEVNYQIRKDIATFIFNYRGDLKDRAKWMNYLGIKVSFIEKHAPNPQGKSALEAIKEEKVDNANKVETMFHEGEYIVDICGYLWRVVGIINQFYILEDIDGSESRPAIPIERVNNTSHLWTIKDAKDGDILACESGWTCIFKTLVNDETFSSYCFMDNTKWFCEKGSEYHTLNEDFLKVYNGKIYPATKEQRELLFQKMKEAGYEWDAENKCLIKI